MTFNEFINQVKNLMPYDWDSPFEQVNSFWEQRVKAWMVDMQSLVPSFMDGNVDTITATDVEENEECESGYFAVSQVASLTEVLFIKPNEDNPDCPEVIPMSQVPWKDRFMVINGTALCYSFAFDNQSKQMYVYPRPEGSETIKLHWSGLRHDYDNDTEVPFGLDTIACCAEYVIAHFRRQEDDKMQRYSSHIQSYERLRRRVVLNEERKAKVYSAERHERPVKCNSDCGCN